MGSILLAYMSILATDWQVQIRTPTVTVGRFSPDTVLCVPNFLKWTLLFKYSENGNQVKLSKTVFPPHKGQGLSVIVFLPIIKWKSNPWTNGANIDHDTWQRGLRGAHLCAELAASCEAFCVQACHSYRPAVTFSEGFRFCDASVFSSHPPLGEDTWSVPFAMCCVLTKKKSKLNRCPWACSLHSPLLGHPEGDCIVRFLC